MHCHRGSKDHKKICWVEFPEKAFFAQRTLQARNQSIHEKVFLKSVRAFQSNRTKANLQNFAQRASLKQSQIENESAFS
jgi:hypothetical protein